MNELTLSDRFKSQIVVEKAPMIQPGSVGLKPDDLNLPAALVDEELLRELASIPDRMGFKIGEVADLLGVKQYILRYWETEFDLLKPKKARNNQRYYTRKDVENAFLIRKLLHRDKFSIEGAKAALKGLKKVVKKEKESLLLLERLELLEQRWSEVEKSLVRLKQLFA
jgi:DNA-binding transcriptional MerR regulator